MHSTESWLALEFPHLVLDLVTRGHDGRRELPIAISDGDSRKPRVLDCNPAAERLGIRPGLTLSAALGLAEGLQVNQAEPDVTISALERLAAWCYQFSSQVCILHERHCLLVEAGASQRLFGEPPELARRLAVRLQRLGYHARSGTAPTPEAAQVAARRSLHIADRTELDQVLPTLPLTALHLDSGQAAALEKMGFSKVAEVMRLPRKALARRLGPAMVDHLDRLTGLRPDPRTAWRPPEHFAAGMDLPEVAQTQGLVFPLRRLVDELCGVLRAGDYGVQEFHVLLTLRKGEERMRLGLQTPGRDEAHLMLLLRERLERLRLAQPVRHIRLEAAQLLPFESRQDGLFRDGLGQENRGEQADAVEPLLERLSARLGKAAVSGLDGVQDHRPEYSWAQRSPTGKAACKPMPHRPVWLLPRAEPCRIENYRVLAGPERIESGWWDGHDCRRDYFVVRDRHGATHWAYREYKPRQGWFLHGLFG